MICRGITKDGNRCNNQIKGGDYCKWHLNREKCLNVYNPNDHSCEEYNDGITSGVFRINQWEWEYIFRKISENKEYKNYEIDYSNGGHGCTMMFDLPKLYGDCIILKSLGKHKSDDSLLKMFRNAIDNIE